MPDKKTDKKGKESSANDGVSETKDPVPGGFNDETFQLKATNGRKFPTNIVSRVLFHDATKRLFIPYHHFWVFLFNTSLFFLILDSCVVRLTTPAHT